MRRCRIESLGVSLPRRRLRRWGSVRHAVEAGRRCLAASHYRPGDVEVLVNTGVYRDRHTCEPAMACYIQHRLGINVEFQGRRTASFDLLDGGVGMLSACLLYTSDAADELLCVDLGGCRIIKKKKNQQKLNKCEKCITNTHYPHNNRSNTTGLSIVYRFLLTLID